MAERSGRKAVESLLYSTDRVRILDMVTKMGEMASEALGMAVRSLVDRDDDLAWSVIEGDDAIDRMEEFIDQECLGSIAMRRPGDAELRFVFAALKIITDLERIGDHAFDIAKIVQVIGKEPLIKPLVDIPRMSALAQTMLDESLQAYLNLDIQLAEKVCRDDDVVDQLYHQVFRELLTYMLADPSKINQATQLIFVARYLERIADHSTNVAEWVIYLVTGERLRKK